MEFGASYIRGLTANTINEIAECPPKPMIFHLLMLQNQEMVHQKLCSPRHHLLCKQNSYMQNLTHHIMTISPNMFWDWCNIRSISTFMYGHYLHKLGVINSIVVDAVVLQRQHWYLHNLQGNVSSCQIKHHIGKKIWWQCLVPTSTTRFTSDVGCRMAQNWIWLYKEIIFMNNDI